MGSCSGRSRLSSASVPRIVTPHSSSISLSSHWPRQWSNVHPALSRRSCSLPKTPLLASNTSFPCWFRRGSSCGREPGLSRASRALVAYVAHRAYGVSLAAEPASSVASSARIISSARPFSTATVTYASANSALSLRNSAIERSLTSRPSSNARNAARRGPFHSEASRASLLIPSNVAPSADSGIVYERSACAPVVRSASSTNRPHRTSSSMSCASSGREAESEILSHGRGSDSPNTSVFLSI